MKTDEKIGKNNVSWVGKVDWELLKFHGMITLHKGSTYNSYLVEEGKTVLIDTVCCHLQSLWTISKEIDLNKIDYIIVNRRS